jgi:outer membrane protein assembly factor BamB
VSGKKLWEFDTNPKDSVWPKTRNEVIATPVIFENVVYIANGQDPEHGEGVGHAYAIDATKRGDITESGRIWHYDKIRRTISTPAIADGLIYWPDFSGFLHCLDLKTGQALWTHDMFAAIWGSPLLADGKLYLGDEDGDIVIMQPGKTLKVLGEMNMGSSVYSSPVPANGTLYLSNRNQLYALKTGASGGPATGAKKPATEGGTPPAPVTPPGAQQPPAQKPPAAPPATQKPPVSESPSQAGARP